MAKDGTNRGGPRPGQGRPPKPLVDRINDGLEAQVIDFPEPVLLDGEDMPKVKDFLKEEQRCGKQLYAEEVFEETWKWLKDRGCERLISVQLLEEYSLAYGRWRQCEEIISEYGFLAKHPTTGAAIASPYVAMSKDYMKTVNAIWYQIFSIVKENSLSAFDGPNPQEDMMERLLRSKK